MIATDSSCKCFEMYMTYKKMFEINVIIGTLKASIKSNNNYINPVKGNLWEINANNYYCYF